MARPNQGPQLKKNERGVWEIHWTESGRSRRLSTRSSDAKAAKQVLASFILGVEREKGKKDCLTVAHLVNDYLTEHVEKKVISKETAELAAARIVKHFGHLEPANIAPGDVASYEQKRRAGAFGKKVKSNGTLRRDLGVLIAALNHAVKTKRIPRADVPHIPLPEEPPPKDRWLTDEERDRLLAAAQPADAKRLTRAYRFIVLALGTASRKRALETLTWTQVDFERKVIYLNPPGRRQTKKRRPTLPMSAAVHEVLKRAYAERKQDGVVGYVLDNPGNVRKTFETAVSVAGLRDVTPHTLRHTWATRAAQRGVPLWKIAGVLGDDIKTVMDRYMHHCPEDLRDAVDTMSEMPTDAEMEDCDVR